MPKFVMENRDQCARTESEFVLGFIEAMLFTETSPAFDSDEWFSDECRDAQEQGQADGTLPGDVGYCDIHPDSLAAIRADCEAWQAANADLLRQACDRPGYDMAQAGRDYWFTRNGHGVGFWSRAELESDDSEYERLTALIMHHAAAGDDPDDSKWQAAFDARARLSTESLGELLSAAAGRREINPFYGNHGDAHFVHVDI